MSQQELPGFNQEPGTRNQKPVDCLGMTFPNDEEHPKEYAECVFRGFIVDPQGGKP
jgi:hypothetical protein